MAKPIGALALNPSHALYSNVVALVIMESDGNVRELVTDLSLGVKTSATVSGELGLTESVTGINLGVDFSTVFSDFANDTAEMSWGYYGEIPGPAWTSGMWSLYGNSDVAPGAAGAGELTFGHDNYDRLNIYRGWSGSSINNGASGTIRGTNGVAELAGTSTTKSVPGLWNTKFYVDGVNKANDSSASFNTSSDIPGAGNTHYFNVKGTTDFPAVYHVIFNKALSTAEWSSLAADPYGLVQAAGGGGGSSFQVAWVMNANTLIGGL